MVTALPPARASLDFPPLAPLDCGRCRRRARQSRQRGAPQVRRGAPPPPPPLRSGGATPAAPVAEERHRRRSSVPAATASPRTAPAPWRRRGGVSRRVGAPPLEEFRELVDRTRRRGARTTSMPRRWRSTEPRSARAALVHRMQASTRAHVIALDTHAIVRSYLRPPRPFRDPGGRLCHRFRDEKHLMRTRRSSARPAGAMLIRRRTGSMVGAISRRLLACTTPSRRRRRPRRALRPPSTRRCARRSTSTCRASGRRATSASRRRSGSSTTATRCGSARDRPRGASGASRPGGRRRGSPSARRTVRASPPPASCAATRPSRRR